MMTALEVNVFKCFGMNNILVKNDVGMFSIYSKVSYILEFA